MSEPLHRLADGRTPEERILEELRRLSGGGIAAAMLALRLESRGRTEALRMSAAELEAGTAERRELLQAVAYPTVLSFLLAAGLGILSSAISRGVIVDGLAELPGALEAAVFSCLSVLLGITLPSVAVVITASPRRPNRSGLLALLREALLTSSSLGSAVGRLRRLLRELDTPWEPLELAAARLMEGRPLSDALEPLTPPLRRDDLEQMLRRPDRGSALALLQSLLRFQELRRRGSRKRRRDYLPLLGLAALGALLLLSATLVVLPVMNSFLQFPLP